MRKVLLVDDNDDFRNVTKRNLENKGYEVLTASVAKEGVEMAISEKPDIILMDIRLPSNKRGIGAARNLRQNDSTRDIPIIFVSGYAQGPSTNEVANIQNCYYLIKPFEISKLLQLMGEVLDGNYSG